MLKEQPLPQLRPLADNTLEKISSDFKVEKSLLEKVCSLTKVSAVTQAQKIAAQLPRKTFEERLAEANAKMDAEAAATNNSQ